MYTATETTGTAPASLPPSAPTGQGARQETAPRGKIRYLTSISKSSCQWTLLPNCIECIAVPGGVGIKRIKSDDDKNAFSSSSSFGVCCVFVLRGGSDGNTVTQNCTYVQNTGFPSALTDTTAMSFTVQKCSDGAAMFGNSMGKLCFNILCDFFLKKRRLLSPPGLWDLQPGRDQRERQRQRGGLRRHVHGHG